MHCQTIALRSQQRGVAQKFSFTDLARSNAYDVGNLGELIPIQPSGVNSDDVTKPCTVKPLCFDFSKEAAWLNDKANIAAIGAKKVVGPVGVVRWKLGLSSLEIDGDSCVPPTLHVVMLMMRAICGS